MGKVVAVCISPKRGDSKTKCRENTFNKGLWD